MEEKIECKECCREISKETYEKYHGYCKNCYEEKKQLKDDVNYETSITASLFKIGGVIGFIASAIVLIVIFCGILDFFIFLYVLGSGLILYSVGEIIELLWNIRENLEKINKRKK